MSKSWKPGFLGVQEVDEEKVVAVFPAAGVLKRVDEVVRIAAAGKRGDIQLAVCQVRFGDAPFGGGQGLCQDQRQQRQRRSAEGVLVNPCSGIIHACAGHIFTGPRSRAPLFRGHPQLWAGVAPAWLAARHWRCCRTEAILPVVPVSAAFARRSRNPSTRSPPASPGLSPLSHRPWPRPGRDR